MTHMNHNTAPVRNEIVFLDSNAVDVVNTCSILQEIPRIVGISCALLIVCSAKQIGMQESKPHLLEFKGIFYKLSYFKDES